MDVTTSSQEVGSDAVCWLAVPSRETVMAVQCPVVVAAPTGRPREALTPRRAATDTLLVRNGEAKSLAIVRCYSRVQAREATKTQETRMRIRAAAERASG